MLKTTKIPLRNLQHPLRLQGWHLDDALEDPGIGQLFWKLICSLLDASVGHPVCQKAPRILLGSNSFLLDSRMTLWRHIGDQHFPGRWIFENWYAASFMYPWDIYYVKSHQHSIEEQPVASSQLYTSRHKWIKWTKLNSGL